MFTAPWDQRLARVLVRPLATSRVHPNHLTTLSLIFGLTASLLFLMHGVEAADIAAALYMAAVFTDHADGELARMSGKTSRFGHQYDFIVGGVNYTCLFIAIGVGLSDGSSSWPLFLGLAAGLSNPLILSMRMQLDARHGKKAVAHPSRMGFEIEDFIYLIGPITWFAGVRYFFIPFGLGTLGYLAWTVYEYVRWNYPHLTGVR